MTRLLLGALVFISLCFSGCVGFRVAADLARCQVAEATHGGKCD